MVPEDHVITSSNVTEKSAWAFCSCGEVFTITTSTMYSYPHQTYEMLQSVSRDFKRHVEQLAYEFERDH